MNNNHIFVYGSLKSGKYNFGRFGKTKVIKKNVEISGYQLFDLGPYPCVVKTNDLHDFVIGEIQSVNDDIFQHINWMEIGAGYTPELIDIGGMIDKVTIYTMNVDNIKYFKSAKLIKSGVW